VFEFTFASGAREPDAAMRADTRVLPQELRKSVVRRAADTTGVHETTSCLHQFRHQERNTTVRYAHHL